MIFKLRGYYKMPRDLILLMVKGDLTFYQFGLLSIYIGLADWDKRHKNYAVAKISNRKLSKILRLNKDRIAFEKQILEVKGFIKIIRKRYNRQFVKICNPKIYFESWKDKDIKSEKKDSLSALDDVLEM